MGSSLTIPEMLEVLRSDALSEENFSLITSHIILPEYHDALWVAVDDGSLDVEKVGKISDFVIENPKFVPDLKVASLLFFLVGWSEYRKENYQRAHEGAHGALMVAKNYGPAKKLLELIHDHIDQSRIPRLTLNEQGRINPIEPTEPEELEINPRWL